MKENIPIEICHDHFERLIKNDVCKSCPSRAENENIIRNISISKSISEDEKFRAIFSELSSIRTSIQDYNKTVESLEHKVDGNGKAGLCERIVVIETRLAMAEKNTGVWVAVLTAIIGAAISLIGLFK